MGMTLVDRAERIVAPIADVVELLPQHWIHGWEESLSFCRNCAEKKIAELKASEPEEEYLLDGGWRTEEDSQRFCETCGEPLDCSFTDYACKEEIRHYKQYGFDLNDELACVSACNIFLALCSDNPDAKWLAREILRQAKASKPAAPSIVDTNPESYFSGTAKMALSGTVQPTAPEPK